MRCTSPALALGIVLLQGLDRRCRHNRASSRRCTQDTVRILLVPPSEWHLAAPSECPVLPLGIVLLQGLGRRCRCIRVSSMRRTPDTGRVLLVPE